LLPALQGEHEQKEGHYLAIRTPPAECSENSNGGVVGMG
jgi:hypothetical protein